VNEIIALLKSLLWGRESYQFKAYDVYEKVKDMRDELSNLEGRKDANVQAIEAENYRLFLLVRFLSGDKDAFKPMVGFDTAHGRSKSFPLSEI